MARTNDRTPLAEPGRRLKHDALRSVVATSARGEIGALISSGRMIRVPVMDLPALSSYDGAPRLEEGTAAKDFLSLAKGERLI